jgi:signal transduction histidine kinase
MSRPLLIRTFGALLALGAIARAHGGQARLESRPGEGTTAIVELPAQTGLRAMA